MAEENLAQNAEQANGEDAVISMVDYLKEEEELENDANAVLGGSDEDQCTFPLVKRKLFLYLVIKVLYEHVTMLPGLLFLSVP